MTILRVHLCDAPGSAAVLAQLQETLDPNITLTIGEIAPPEPANYHVLVAGRPPQDFVAASPDLHTLIIPWAGLAGETAKVMAEFPQVAIFNLHYNAAATAEMAIALLLAAARKLLSTDRVFRTGDWSPRFSANQGMALHGRTALILGYGSIGRRTAEVCRALDMDVLATRRSVKSVSTDGPAEVYPASDLDNLLPRADALIITLPLTPETRGLIDARRLALLPPGGVLVNVGRGNLVEQYALYDALVSGHLRGAGLDVWYNYPNNAEEEAHTLPADAPLHELENVVMSPHIGGDFTSERSEHLRIAHLARTLNALARGETPPNRVNVTAGY
jgi:phosphoglycerate dehydrogenase-like enzyme